jgi:hypothetical protein
LCSNASSVSSPLVLEGLRLGGVPCAMVVSLSRRFTQACGIPGAARRSPNRQNFQGRKPRQGPRVRARAPNSSVVMQHTRCCHGRRPAGRRSDRRIPVSACRALPTDDAQFLHLPVAGD